MAEAAPRLLPLALSLGLANLSHIAIAATDLVMIGWLGPDDLAAAALAANLFYLPLFCLLGFIGGAGAVLARKLGSGDAQGAGGCLMALGLAGGVLILPILALSVLGAPILLALGQDGALVDRGGPYLGWLCWSSPAIGVFAGLWSLAAIRGHAQAIARISLLAIAVNAAGNALFMFGLAGLPALGLVGAGLATFLTTLAKALALLFWLHRQGALAGPFRLGAALHVRRYLPEILGYGLPLALLEGATMGFFACITLLTGLLGAKALAANAIALHTAEIGIAMLFALGEAAAITIAFHHGRNQMQAGWRAIRQALLAALGLSILFGAALALARGPLAALVLTADTAPAGEAADLARSVLLFAAISLPLDCGRIVLVGILRGLGDARWPAAMAISGLWGLGLPLAALFGLGEGQGLPGIWTGMLVAMAAISLVLFLRLHLVRRAGN